ncbi:MAG: hypothetical protein AAF721_31660 [Myxococcota bacterium]
MTTSGFLLRALGAAALLIVPASASAAPTARPTSKASPVNKGKAKTGKGKASSSKGKTSSSKGKTSPSKGKTSSSKGKAPTSKGKAGPSAAPSKTTKVRRRGKARAARGRTMQRVPPTAEAARSTRVLKSATPRGAALVTAAMLTYADGGGKAGVDKRVARALDRVPGGRAAAKRMAARIRAQPAALRSRVLGGHAGLIDGPMSTRSLGDVNTKVLAQLHHPSLGYLRPLAQTLPPEDVGVPNEITLSLAGVRCDGTSDNDGTDELVVLSKVARTWDNAALAFHHELSAAPAGGSLEINNAQTQRIGQSIELSKSGEVLVLTAIAEVDGDPDEARAEIEVAIELAKQLAIDTGGDDVLNTFVATLAYTEGMLRLNNPDSAPSLRAQVVRGNDLQSWWSAPAEQTGGVEWKASVDAVAGGGRYQVFYNVPSQRPELTNVSITLHRARLLDWDVAKYGFLHLRVSINGHSATRQMAPGVADGNPVMRVQRQVQPGDARVKITLTRVPGYDSWTKRRNGRVKRYFCGWPENGSPRGENMGPCPVSKGKEIDIAPGNPTRELGFIVDPTTAGIRGQRMPQGGQYKFRGTQQARGEVTLSVSRD